MKHYTIHFLPADMTVRVEENTSLLQAQILAGLRPDAPCGGKGTCRKCTVTLDGRLVLACQTVANRDMTVYTSQDAAAQILTKAESASFRTDGTDEYCLAFDVGTTTLVGYLLDRKTGTPLAQLGKMNPQAQYGADVISRIQCVLEGQ